jgi:hypothetical protein
MLLEMVTTNLFSVTFVLNILKYSNYTVVVTVAESDAF